MNETGKSHSIRAETVPPARYELIAADGHKVADDHSPQYLADMARRIFPDQEQDPGRTGKGWDVQVCGAGR